MRVCALVANLAGTVLADTVLADTVFADTVFADTVLADAESDATTTEATTPSDSAGRFAGRSLSEALRSLQKRGLRIVFNSHLISRDLRVTSEPAASEPRQILAQILKPHGLTTRDGPGGRLIVVKPSHQPLSSGSARGTVRGTVHSRATGEPLPGIEIIALGTGQKSQTDSQGRFELEGLAAGQQTLEARGPALSTQRHRALIITPGSTAEAHFELEPSAITHEVILVTPSQSTAQEPQALQRPSTRDREAAIHLDQDVFQSLSSLPGVSGLEDSAQFSLRGGRPDEVMVVLDGLEIVDPFHMRDFGNTLSLITPTAVEVVELRGDGFQATYGDRMGGVLEMTTARPEDGFSSQLTIGDEAFQIGASGTFLGQKGRWLAAGRSGDPDVPRATDELQQEARFWDGFAKVELQLSPRHNLRAHGLQASDDFSFVTQNADPFDLSESDQFNTDSTDTYFWLTHHALLGSSLTVTTSGSVGKLMRDRFGRKDPESADFSIQDQRDVKRPEVRQAWKLQVGDSQQIDWGFEARRYSVTTFYRNTPPSTFDPRFVFPPLESPTSAALDGEQEGAYVIGRWRPRSFLALDAGLRYDRTSFTDDEHASPRLNLAASLGQGTTFRAAWGLFTQSQRPYELQIPDGETSFSESEASEHRTLGLEHSLGHGVALQVAAYQRRVRNPRGLFENLLKPVSRFPEIESDRTLVAPSSRRNHGLELTLHGTHRNIDWQWTYAHARVIESFDGVRIPSRLDQPHSMRFETTYRTPWRLDLRLIWAGHSGRPSTPLSGRRVEGANGEMTFEPVFGPRNSERLPATHRLELQAHSQVRFRKLLLDVYLGLENLYDRKNVRGFGTDFTFALEPSGKVAARAEPELGEGRAATFGIRLGF